VSGTLYDNDHNVMYRVFVFSLDSDPSTYEIRMVASNDENMDTSGILRHMAEQYPDIFPDIKGWTSRLTNKKSD